MKTITRPWRLAFFERRPGLALPRLHGIVVALDSPTLGLLYRKAQIAQQAPDLRLPELDAVQPLDEYAHALECPQLGAESVLGRALQQDAAQGLQLLLVQPRRPTAGGHGAQSVDTTLIEHRLPGVRGLPRHAHRMRCLRGRLASQQHSSSLHPLANRLVQPLCCHLLHPIPNKYPYNASAANQLS